MPAKKQTSFTPPLPVRKLRGYGWKPDPPDHRDLIFAVQRPDRMTVALPPKVDLRETGFFSPCYQQLQTSSCTANALAAAEEFVLNKEQGTKAGDEKAASTPSRLFIYWNERYMEDSTGMDGGAFIRDGVRSMAKVGVCDEKTWPFVESQVCARPCKAAFVEAKPRTIDAYFRLKTFDEMKACLAAGYPFTVGFTVFESFEGKLIEKTGELKMPLPGEKELGGHAVLVVGYDDSIGRFIIRNSWGTDWGMNGYFTAPYLFITSPKYSSDFWTIRKS